MNGLKVYNSYTREKEEFVSLTPGHVGMYVCGPTVSGESHLGHARPYITFDVTVPLPPVPVAIKCAMYAILPMPAILKKKVVKQKIRFLKKQ